MNPTVEEYGLETLNQFLKFTELSGIEDTQANFDVLQATVRATYPQFKDKTKVITHDAYAAVYFSIKDKLTHVPAPVVEPIVQTVTMEKKSRAEKAEERFLHEEAVRRSGLPSQEDLREEAKKKHDLARQFLSSLGKVQEALTSKPEVDNSVQIARRTLPANPETITRAQAISFLKDPEITAQTIRKVYQEYPAIKKRIAEVTRNG